MSTEQVAVQKRRTARSRRFLIRLGILGAAFAAAFLAGAAAAHADEQNADPEVVQGESAATAQLPDDMPPPEDMPPADDAEPGPVPSPEPSPEDGGTPAPTDSTDLLGTVTAATEIVAETAELVEEVPAAGVAAPVVGTVAHAVRGVAATSDTVLGGAELGGSDLVANALHVVSQTVVPGGHPEGAPGTEAPAPQSPAPQGPSHQSSGGPIVLPAVGGFERDRQLAPLPAEMSRPAATPTSAAGSGTADLRSQSVVAAPVEAPAAISLDLGGDSPLTELLGGDHGVVSGGGGAGVADRVTPGSAWYGDRAGLVSEPVRTDARPHIAPVAPPGFAPD